jgi:hypothetical protein
MHRIMNNHVYIVILTAPRSKIKHESGMSNWRGHPEKRLLGELRGSKGTGL